MTEPNARPHQGASDSSQQPDEQQHAARLAELIMHRGGNPSATRAFTAILWRDIFVTGKEFPIFLAQVILQPLFLLFIFGEVLGELGYTEAGYADVLFPGIVALTAFLTALQNTALPLVLDFSFSKEIEDRLLAPLPTNLVAIEKLVISTVRALIAAATMFPLGYWMLGPLPVGWADVPLVVVYIALGGLTGSALGLTLGTWVPPERINIMFALVMTPVIFTGSTQFPWPELDRLPWFQVVTAFNPLTYVSELMRAEITTDLPHLSEGICLLALAGFLTLLLTVGIIGFRRRALD